MNADRLGPGRDHRRTVVFVDHCARLSGAELALSRLVAELARDIDVVVVLGEDGPLVGRLEQSGVRVRVLPMAGGLRERRRDSPGRLADIVGTWLYAWRLRSLLRELGADLVHTNSLKAAVYGGLAGRLAKVPVVWHVRDRIADDYLPSVAVKVVRMLALLLPQVVLANSQATRVTLPRPGETIVIPDSVAAVEPHPRPSAEAALIFGVVGRLAPWKGQHVFLAAFAAACAGTGHRAQLVGSAMFGEQAYEQSLRDLVRVLDIVAQVEFMGFREEIDQEYEGMDVLVHCSTIPEPFGQVVIEGQAHGLCVVAANAGGPAEIISHEVDGLLTPPGDVAALADALRRLAGDPALRRRLEGAGRLNAAQYTGARTAQAVRDVYDRLLAPKP